MAKKEKLNTITIYERMTVPTVGAQHIDFGEQHHKNIRQDRPALQCETSWLGILLWEKRKGKKMPFRVIVVRFAG